MSSLTQAYSEKYKDTLTKLGYQNDNQLRTILISFYSAVTSSFKWNKLPTHIPFFFPERWLYFNGMVAAYSDSNHDGHIDIYPCFGNGAITEYGLFDNYTLVKRNGETIIKGIEDIELCYNNTLALPSFIMVNELSEKCNNALTAVNNTLTRAAFSRLIECTTQESLDKIMAILGGNDITKIAIPTLSRALKNGEVNIHNLFDNKADDVLALWDVYVRYRNMFYTTFGFDTVEIQKKERLTEAEGSANSEINRYSLFNDMFTCRKDFEERVQNRFGYDMNIDINRNSPTVYALQLDNESKIDNELIEISKGSNLQLDSNEESEVEVDEV